MFCKNAYSKYFNLGYRGVLSVQKVRIGYVIKISGQQSVLQSVTTIFSRYEYSCGDKKHKLLGKMFTLFYKSCKGLKIEQNNNSMVQDWKCCTN